MTDESRGIGGPAVRPGLSTCSPTCTPVSWTTTRAAELWPQVNEDPEAQAVLAHWTPPRPTSPARRRARATDARGVRRPARRGDRRRSAAAVPGRPSRTHAGVAAGRSARPGRGPRRGAAARNRRLGWAAGSLTAAAAAVVAMAVAVPEHGAGRPAPRTRGPSSAAGPSVGSDGIGAAPNRHGDRRPRLRPTARRPDAGRLPRGRRAARNVRPGASGRSTSAARPACMIILTTGKPAQFRLLAFGADCGPGNPASSSTRSSGEVASPGHGPLRKQACHPWEHGHLRSC